MKKEELIKQNGELTEKINRMLQLDKKQREDFARVFGWLDKSPYGYEYAPKDPGWSEIFTHIGRLLESHKFTGYVQRLDILDRYCHDIAAEVFKDRKPPTP